MNTPSTQPTAVKKLFLFLSFFILLAGNLFAQPVFDSARYNREDQRFIDVYFSETLTWSNAGTWTIKIGGTAVAGVLGPNGSGTNNLVFLLPNPIEYSDVQAGVTVEYAGDGNVHGSSGALAAFGPETAIDNVIVDCSMLTGVQGISVDALSGPCAPVTVTLSFFWEWSRQARNSTDFDTISNRALVLWNDPSNNTQYVFLKEVDNTGNYSLGSRVFQGSASFTYPAGGTECVYEPHVFPNLHWGTVWCRGGSAEMAQALTNWNTDDLGSGQLNIDPAYTPVCLGQSFNEVLTDATLFNCRRDVEPNKPNVGPRDVQFVYGTKSGRQIPNVWADGHQITDAAGNLVAGVYEDAVVHYDSGAPPFPNAYTLPVTHAGDYTNDQIGDTFQIEIRNWNVCNPYNSGFGTPVVTYANIVIVDGPIADAGPDQAICEGTSATLSGTLSHTATTASWSTAGDGTFADANNLNTTYTPGSGDIANGSVWLYLSTDAAGGCDPFTDSLLLTIDPLPTQPVISISAGSNGFCDDGATSLTLHCSEVSPDGHYEWYRNGTALGHDSPDLTLTTYTQAGDYTVEIYGNTANHCPILSDPFTVNIYQMATVTDPADTRTCDDGPLTDGNATFTVTTGGAAHTLRWQRDAGSGWTDITGATTPDDGCTYGGYTTNTLSITSADDPMDGYRYRAVVTTTAGGCQTFSGAATLTVDPLPSITGPADVTACELAPATFSATSTIARGTITSVYWRRYNGSSWATLDGTTDGGIYSGYDSDDLDISAVAESMDGWRYRYIATSDQGCRNRSTAYLYVNPLVDVSGPVDREVCLNGTVSFTSDGDGTPAVTAYRWQRYNGSSWVDITGATTPNDGCTYSGYTTATLTLSNVTTTPDGYRYRCVLTAAGPCDITSAAATLTVNPLPAASITPAAPGEVCNGTTIAFDGNPSGGTGAYTHLWSGTGAGDLDNTSTQTPNYTAPVVATQTVYGLTYTVTDSKGCQASDNVSVTVNPPPTNAVIGNDQSICTGSPATLTVTITGGTSPYTVVYTDGTSNFTVNNYTSGSAITTGNLTATTTFTLVSVTDAKGCSSLALNGAAVVTVGSLPTAATLGSDATLCDGESTGLSVTISGGAPPYTVVYNDGSSDHTVNNYQSGDDITVTPPVGATTYHLVSVTDNCGNSVPAGSLSGTPTVTVYAYPVITGQPGDDAVCENSAATFSVTATGGTLSYQWQEDRNDGNGFQDLADDATYSGSGTASLTVTAPYTFNGYRYRVVVTESAHCSVTSNAATLQVDDAPFIGTQPTDEVICETENAVFSVAATGTNITYQWYESTNGGTTWSPLSNTAPYSGVTSNTLTITNATTALDGHLYHVIVSGPICPSVTSNDVSLRVDEAPAIVTQPHNAVICETEDTSFTVVATGTALTYRWDYTTDGTTWNVVPNAPPYSGFNQPTLTITGATTALDGNAYRVTVGGPNCPSVTSVTVTLQVDDAPAITGQPVDAATCDGGTVTYTVAATGTAITYQWQESIDGGTTWNNLSNGAPYSGVTTPTLTLSPATVTMDNRYYRAVVSGPHCPDAVTNAAHLRVDAPPAITADPVAVTICENTNTSFSFSAGGDALTYAWEVSTDGGATWNTVSDGGVYSGATTTTLTLTGVPYTMNGYRYRGIADGPYCPAAVTAAALLTVDQIPTITGNPADSIVCETGDATFSVTVQGTDPLYQWQVSTDGGSSWSDLSDDATYNNVTTATLQVHNALFTMNGYRYRVRVTAPVCSQVTYSASALLTVDEAPAIDTQPHDSAVCDGGNAAFAVVAHGTSLSYQWQVLNGSWTDLTDGLVYGGTQTPTLTLATVTTAYDGNLYRVVISGPHCPDAVSNAVTLTVHAYPVITTQPADLQMCAYGSGIFSVTAGGTVLSYQWQVDDGSGYVDLADTGIYSGTATATLHLNGPTSYHDGFHYRVTVTESGTCDVLSAPAALDVVPAPNTSPIGGGGDTALCVGTTGEYYAVTNHAGNSYNWVIPAGVTVANGGGGSDNWVVLDYPNAGDYTISVTEYTPPPASCPGVTQTLDIHVYNPPVADAGSDAVICEGLSTVLGGSPAAGGGSGDYTYTWSPSYGLDDASLPNPVAAPAVTTTYILYVQDNISGCGMVSDTAVVTVTPLPAVSAGSDGATCEQVPYDLAGSSPTASDYTSLLWTTSGTGSFDDAALLTPVYTPSAGDVGQVQLILTAQGGAPCGTVSDTMTLTLTPPPVADAGSDETTCQGVAFDLSLSAVPPTVTNSSAVVWSTPDGTGTFNNTTILTPTYTPGAAETGTVHLVLRALGNGTCAFDEDTMVLTILPAPVADAGSNGETCEDTPFSLASLAVPPSATNYTSVHWTHDGSGAFTDADVLTPVYNPAAGETGIVTLTMTVTGTAPCTAVTDHMALTIHANPVLDPALDRTVCSGEASGITLAVAGGSVAADHYDLPAIRVAAGLTDPGGNTVPGTGLSAAAIAGDVYVNTTPTPLTVEYDVVPVSASGCAGDTVTVTLTVDPEPVLTAGLDATVCSGEASGIVLSTVATSVAADHYDIQAIRVAGGLTAAPANASPGPGQGATALAGDVFTNTTATALTVEYDVIPVSAAGCEGAPVTITLTVDPEPVLASGLNNSVCSDEPAAITLAVASTSVAAAAYDLAAIRVAAGLVAHGGNAVPGTGQGPGAIAHDAFTNTTNATLTVEYDVAPVSAAGCTGDTVTITLSVAPEPVLAPSLDDTVCSNSPAGIVFATNGTSVNAINYNIIAIRRDGGLSPTGGNAAPGNGQSANAIANDIFINDASATPLNVEYDVAPVSAAGCVGDTVTVTLTVNPEPVLSPALDATVCSDEAAAIVLGTNGTSVAADHYNIVDIRKAYSLVAHSGNAAPGNGQDATALAGDVFTNTTAGPLTVEYDVVPVSAAGCEGAMVTVTLTVNPEPVLNPSLDATVCSGQNTGITLATNGTSVTAADYNIVSVTPDPLLTVVSVVTPGPGQGANAIAGDIFTNTTAGPLTVVYAIAPRSAAGCSGDTATVTLTVTPEPVLDPALDTTVCSGQSAGIVLGTIASSVAAATYNITAITPAAGLVAAAGNAVPGNGQGANALAGDIFTNTTATALTVTYTVVPVSAAGCEGAPVTVTLTVNPEPVLDPTLDATVCSDEAAGIVLGTVASSVAADHYNLITLRKAASLVAHSGNATPGSGYDQNVLAGDVFTNTTASALTVEYDLVPVSADGCEGSMVTVTLTVAPEPVLDPNLDASVCSDQPAAITLATNGISVAAATYDIPAIRADAALTKVSGATPGPGQGANALANDVYTNTTGGALNVEYDIVPVSADGCRGDTVTVTLTVHPEPVLAADLDTTVCSGQSSGIVLATDGASVAAARYHIKDIRVDSHLGVTAGNAVPGDNQGANALAGDIFTNTTATPWTVAYDVVPVSAAGCEGDLVTVTLTVNPEPVTSPSLNTTICSDAPTGVVLTTDGTSVAAATWNITAIRVATGLTPYGGNAVTGDGQGANALAGDRFTNTTTLPLTVDYDVVPVSADGCEGALTTLTVTVNPKPVLDPALDATVCSDIAGGITLRTLASAVAADHYDITTITAAGNLTKVAGATPGDGQDAAAIAGDIYNNVSSTAGTVVYEVAPVSAAGCRGDTVAVTLTVNPEPVLASGLDNAVCSDDSAAITLATDGFSVDADHYNLTAIRVAAGLTPHTGNAVTGSGYDAHVLGGDRFTNTTAADLTVQYDIVPVSADGCEGNMVTVTLTVHPEPVIPVLDATVCSDEPSGITLMTDGTSVAADHYDLTAIRVAAGLTPHSGNAVPGAGQGSAAIVNDAFTNTTAFPLTVEYDVVAVSSGSCAGDTVTITLTVAPEPVTAAALDATVCSDHAAGITLATNGTSVAAASWNIVAITPQAGLTKVAGATPGDGQSASAIASDIYNNVTATPLDVVYEVSPVSGDGCRGDTVTITLTVTPEPVALTQSTTVCSDEPSGIFLHTDGTSVAASSWTLAAIRVAAGLTAAPTNAVTGAGYDSTVIAADTFTNTTGSVLTVEYDVIPYSSVHCPGDPVTLTLTVAPEPVLAPGLDAAVCSGSSSGILLKTNGTSVSADHYDIPAIRVAAGLVAAAGNAVPGPGQADNALAGDVFTNTTSGPLTVEYDVVPVSAASCTGDTVTVTLTVNAEPVAATPDTTLCSDQTTGLPLSTDGTSVAAASWNLLQVLPQAGLAPHAGNATPGNGKPAAVIANDAFTNTSGGDLTVTYIVVPVSGGGCEGAQDTITVTVRPEPVLDQGLDRNICSDSETGLVLDVAAGSVAAHDYNIVNIDVATGLVAAAGNNPGGSHQADTALMHDVFTNTSGIPLDVVYDVVPVSLDGCEGDLVQVTVTVSPEPLLNPALDRHVCSDVASGLQLSVAAGSVAADHYDLVSVAADAALTPHGTNQAPAPGLSASALAGDAFTNTSGLPLDVVYTLVPVNSSGCAGDTATVTLTVDPEPVLDPSIDSTTCSDAAAGIVLDVAAGSVGAITYDIFLNHKDNGLTGTATTGVALDAHALAGDVFTNRTAAPLQVVWDVTPVSGGGCRGDVQTVTLTVNPEPVLAGDLNRSVCSGLPTGLVLDVSAGSVAAASYNIVNISVSGGLTPAAGNAGPGDGLPADTLSHDIFTNTTNAPLTVVYDVVPVSGDGCEGDLVQVTVTVNPEPVTDTPDAVTCSDQPSGITLTTLGSAAAALTWDITAIDADAALIPHGSNAVTGTGYGADVLVNDAFTNTSNGPLSVVYTVVPVSGGGCAGDTAHITLTVNAEPVIVAGLDSTVCSGATAGIVFATEPSGTGAASYTITGIAVDGGLTPAAGNATPGTGRPAAAIAGDIFTNKTPTPLHVVYSVLPVSGDGCEGNVVQITLTVNPEPVADPGMSAALCSDEPTGITLAVKSGSAAAATWNLTNISMEAGLVAGAGNATPGNGLAADTIYNDTFTNLTGGDLHVVYDVVPVSAEGCEGETEQITVTVHAEPLLANGLDNTVCSRAPAAITLAVAPGSVAASSYTLAAVDVPAGLTPAATNALPGPAKPAGVLANDSYTNTSGGDLDVLYHVLPVSGNGCAGDTAVIRLTVHAEPVLATPDDTVCSGQPAGITLDVTAGSTGAVAYNIYNISVDYGLTPAAGNAVPGNGLPADTLAGDVFTNLTGAPLTVRYDVAPVSGDGCTGETRTITLTVRPEPQLDPGLNATVCSGTTTGITLRVVPASVAAATYNIVNINVDPQLTAAAGNAVPGNGLAADTIFNDRFTNLTNTPLQVVYDVVPVSSDGCEGAMRQITVTVQPEPILTAGLGETVCSGIMTNILLSNSNNVPGTHYMWDAPVTTGGMTGGNAGSSVMITDVFTNMTGAPQTATYHVVPVSGTGCPGDTGTVVVTVNPNPVTDILGDGVSGDTLQMCGGHDLLLDGNPSGGSGSYTTHLWAGNTAPLDAVDVQTPVFNARFSGSYLLIYTVTDSRGCQGSDQVVVNVDSPKAIYSADNLAGCDRLTVQFTNNSIGATSYLWDFGDGTTSTEVSPVHDFDNLTTQIAYFDVKLTATSDNGCRDSMIQTMTVYPTVQANFYITPDTLCHGDAAVTLIADPGASAYHWDYGDGNAEYGGNVVMHTYTNVTTSPVTHTATLITSSFYSCTDTATYDVTIYPMPVPAFTPVPASQTWPNATVTFNNGTNSGTWTYLWDFGDGTTSTEVSPEHTYAAPGIYTVWLKVNNDRCVDSVSGEVEIKPIPPVAGFENVPPACSPYEVSFVNTSQDATTYLWDFGDGTVTDRENPVHTFYEAGLYHVRLTATGPGGTDRYEQLIEVYQTPTSFLGVTPDTVYAGWDKVKCFNLSTYGDTYVWEFGDGDTSTLYEPFHMYEEPGIYDITLNVYTHNGCQATFTLSPAVTVLPAGGVHFANAFRPNPNGPSGGEIPPPSQINTVFFPPIHEQIDDYHLQIFDRWGELIFESFDLNVGWDGYYKGHLCQQGVYIWKVEGKYANGKPFRKAGDITLLH